VKVWDATTGKEVLTLEGHTSIVTSVCFSPDGTHLASASRASENDEPGEVKVWEARTGKELLRFKGHTDWVTSVCFSPDGRHLASASLDRTVKLWDTTTGQQPLVLGHPSGVFGVCFSPGGKRLASACIDQTVRVWDVFTAQLHLTLKGHTAEVYSVCFSPDGKRLVSGGGNWAKPGELKVWDAHTGKEVFNLVGHPVGVTSVSFSSNGQWIASACWDQTVKVWDAHTGRDLLTLRGHGGPVLSVCFSPDSKRLASGGGSTFGEVKVWDIPTGKEVLTLKRYSGAVWSVCFSPDGQRLASAGGDRTVKVWDAATGQEQLTLIGHTNAITTVCFSPDGTRLASGGGRQFAHAGEVKVWDVQTGQETISLRGHRSIVRSVCFSPDGHRLASASFDSTLRLWDALPAADGLAGQRLWVEPDDRWHGDQAENAQQAGDWYACAFHLGHLLRQRPREAGLHIRRAYALSRLGRTAEAGAHRLQALLLDRGLSPWPLDPAATGRGQAAAQRKNWSEAAADLELAAHQPGAPLAAWSDWLLTRCAAAPKDVPPACRQLLDQFEKDGRSAPQLVSACLVAAGDEAAARRLARVAERLVAQRRDASTLHLYGAALHRAGRFKEAADTLRQAVAAQGKGGDAETWLFLALAEQRLGQGTHAREHFFRFEDWLKGRTFTTWQQRLRWRLLHEEARTLVLAMPRSTD
jgi:WD40 repeat protein/tetratricopeptide (TPR) repeat protein